MSHSLQKSIITENNIYGIVSAHNTRKCLRCDRSYEVESDGICTLCKLKEKHEANCAALNKKIEHKPCLRCKKDWYVSTLEAGICPICKIDKYVFDMS